MSMNPGWTVGEWFAVQVWTGREHLTAAHLRMRGYEVFLPSYEERRRWSDRTKIIRRALFAGYLFSRTHPEAVGKIVTAPGVIRIVGEGGAPLPVPSHEIEAIQRIVETRLTVEPWTLLQAGQRVRVDHGPLAGIEGVVLMTKSHRRLVVSVSLLRRSVAVEIEADWVTIPTSALLSAL